ncbi:MAG: hypothetical protein MUC96_20300 [Myxococcaceae bacterium]|jgi:hypothetical protein|nr:hypothetical protein [Myxococcaceae bacterium]
MSERKISPKRSLQQRLRRGQAMIEYSVVSHALLLIGGTSMLGIAQYLRLFQSIDTYLRSVYTVLRMGGI